MYETRGYKAEHTYQVEVQAWMLVDLMIQLADKIHETEGCYSVAMHARMMLAYEDVADWCENKLAEGLTYDALSDACEDVYWALSFR